MCTKRDIEDILKQIGESHDLSEPTYQTVFLCNFRKCSVLVSATLRVESITPSYVWYHIPNKSLAVPK